MKIIFALFFVLFSSLTFAQMDCSLDNPEGCDGDIEITSSPAVATPVVPDPGCDLSEPGCDPLHQDYIFNDGITGVNVEKATYFLCFSGNKYTKKYGIGINLNKYFSALAAYRRCFQASGVLGPFCSKPMCMLVYI